MKTTGARKLNHRINSHQHQHKVLIDKVKKRISELPEDHETTYEPDNLSVDD